MEFFSSAYFSEIMETVKSSNIMAKVRKFGRDNGITVRGDADVENPLLYKSFLAELQKQKPKSNHMMHARGILLAGLPVAMASNLPHDAKLEELVYESHGLLGELLKSNPLDMTVSALTTDLVHELVQKMADQKACDDPILTFFIKYVSDHFGINIECVNEPTKPAPKKLAPKPKSSRMPPLVLTNDYYDDIIAWFKHLKETATRDDLYPTRIRHFAQAFGLPIRGETYLRCPKLYALYLSSLRELTSERWHAAATADEVNALQAEMLMGLPILMLSHLPQDKELETLIMQTQDILLLLLKNNVLGVPAALARNYLRREFLGSLAEFEIEHDHPGVPWHKFFLKAYKL